MADLLALSTIPTSVYVTAYEANDSVGNTSVYQWSWNSGASTTLVSPAGLEYGVNHPGPSTYQGPANGTITTTDTGSAGPITVPAGTYNNVELFKSVNTDSIYQPTLNEIDVWAVLGVGPIQLGFPDATTPLICQATNITLH
jgi:hypothetical protein